MSRGWSPIEDALDTRHAVAVAEALLKAYASTTPKLAGPRHIHRQVEERRDLLDIPALTLCHAHPSKAFIQILTEERRMETELFETGHYMARPPAYNLTFFANKEEINVACFVWATIGYADGKRIAIELSEPTVDHIIFADPKSTLADLIRVATYLVRLGCENVGGLCDVSGFLGKAVRRLGQLVRMARLHDGHKPKDETGEAESHADDGANLLDTHTTDSNRSKEQS